MMDLPRILIVDDEAAARQTLEVFLALENYELIFAEGGTEALEQASRKMPDVILCDVMMPDMDGFEVCRRIRSDARLAEVPFIFITALDARRSKLNGLEAGADDFISKPYDSLELRARLRTILRLNRYRKLNEERLKLELAHQELTQAYDATIEGWSRALDLRDQETEGHTLRVTEMTLRLVRAWGIDGEDLAYIRWGALLHDIGKLGVPDAILLKPDQLTEEEWMVMKRHPIHAYEMLSPITFLRRALDIPYCHHEKWDGTGYPRGLKGTAIPLSARIFTVVDVWDAIMSDRPYRSGMSRSQAIDYIRSQTGTAFDPEVAEVFWKLAQSNSVL